MITVAVLTTDAPTIEVRKIDSGLNAMQKIVGGLIEMVSLSDNVDLVCNEEGRLIGLPLNFKIGQMPIVGDVFFTRHNDEGESVSLTEDDVNYLSELVKQLRAGRIRALA